LEGAKMLGDCPAPALPGLGKRPTPDDGRPPSAGTEAGERRHSRCVAERERRRSSDINGVISLEKLGYQWDQNDRVVRIYLNAAALSDDVQSRFEPHGCALTAAVGTRCFFFDIKRTYGEIDPDASRVRVPKHRRNLVLELAKRQVGQEWHELRAVEVESSFLRTLGCAAAS